MNDAHSILVVDDDKDIREIMTLVLGTLGYTVRAAADGLEAIQLLAKGFRPSLIFLDMMMPRMDGEGFLSTVRNDPELADIPVVLLSGHDLTRQKAAELHSSGLLIKPIELEDPIGAAERFAPA